MIHDAEVTFELPKPGPVLRCANCGVYKDDPVFGDGTCMVMVNGYPEPQGAHLWVEVES